jgi:hypothetical protein
VTDQRLGVSPQDHCRPLVCSLIASRPATSASGVIGHAEVVPAADGDSPAVQSVATATNPFPAKYVDVIEQVQRAAVGGVDSLLIPAR